MRRSSNYRQSVVFIKKIYNKFFAATCAVQKTPCASQVVCEACTQARETQKIYKEWLKPLRYVF